MEARKPAPVSPEAKAYSRMIGSKVEIILVGSGPDDRMVVGLVWVDKYTVGFRAGDGKEGMIFKHAIQRISALA